MKSMLPSKFKEWLLFSDGGECFLPAGIQLYGVAHKPLIDVNDNDLMKTILLLVPCLPATRLYVKKQENKSQSIIMKPVELRKTKHILTFLLF